jgi:glycosyltransferase involved in cell wall biosynthesis
VYRVCLVGLIAGGQSGIPRYAAALANALDRVASEFPELSLTLVTTARGAEAACASNISVKLVRGAFADANAGLRRIVAEQIQARSAEADLLHFFDLSGPALAPRRPFVATIHDAAVAHGYERLKMAHKRLLHPWAIRNAVATVAVSAFARDEGVNRFGADPERVHVIHSGPGLVRPAANGEPSPGGGYVLYVGNISAHKNLRLLIAAFGDSGVEERLVLVGNRGERFSEVEQAIERSTARGQIEMRREVGDAELDRLYRGASALVLPSRYEGFGFTALEAMARGCPVLASDIPALREISGSGAWLLPPDDPSAWSRAIRVLAASPQARDRLRARGRKVADGYSWRRTARGVCELFSQIEAAR